MEVKDTGVREELAKAGDFVKLSERCCLGVNPKGKHCWSGEETRVTHGLILKTT